MHAETLVEHERLKREATELCTAWSGTEPMTTEQQVRDAMKMSDVGDKDIDSMLPYVVDACKERGLLK